jgi:molybdenum cofactor cytidylyltransferase
MIFGELALDEAEGAILAHSLRLPELTLKKGRVLSAQDIAALRHTGHAHVMVARLEVGDVGEDLAAGRLAAVLLGENLSSSQAVTGRCNIIADVAGVLVYDRTQLAQLNAVDESLTVAALQTYEVVQPRDMVATVKVIPFAAPSAAVDRFEELARVTPPLFRVAPFRPAVVGLIQTKLPGTKESVLDKTVIAVRGRIEPCGSTLAEEIRCAHDVVALTDCIHRLRTDGCTMVLISGASAITDRRDVIPAAIEAAGGKVLHFGMPVDPGNLLLLAQFADGNPVLGLPGCARSPKLNGFDWVLHRLLAGLSVTARDIQGLGAGGLLKEIPSRPLPRAKATRTPESPRPASPPHQPSIAALVLAAGSSRRMGKVNKLLQPIGGAPMVARVVAAALASRTAPIVVVVGHEAEKVRAALSGLDITIVDNANYADGLSSSLRRGLLAVPPEADGVVICLGDMPWVEGADIDRLVSAFNPVEGRAICVSSHRGRQGNPVLWGRQFFREMQQLSGDQGARSLLQAHAEWIAEVEAPSDAVLIDIDTPAALETAGTS